MNPQRDAADRIGERCDPRVLEPSPPAVSEPPWFADDPVARGDLEPGRTVVFPVPTGDITWVELAAGIPSSAPGVPTVWLAAVQAAGARARIPCRHPALPASARRPSDHCGPGARQR